MTCERVWALKTSAFLYVLYHHMTWEVDGALKTMLAGLTVLLFFDGCGQHVEFDWHHACLYNECLFSLEAVHGERVNMGFSSQTVRSLRLGDCSLRGDVIDAHGHTSFVYVVNIAIMPKLPFVFFRCIKFRLCAVAYMDMIMHIQCFG